MTAENRGGLNLWKWKVNEARPIRFTGGKKGRAGNDVSVEELFDCIEEKRERRIRDCGVIFFPPGVNECIFHESLRYTEKKKNSMKSNMSREFVQGIAGGISAGNNVP